MCTKTSLQVRHFLFQLKFILSATVELYSLIIKTQWIPWASAGGGANASLWNLKMIVIFCSLVKYPKFSVAPSAITIITPNFTLKRRKTATIFIFCQRVKTWQFFSTQLACNAINFVLSRKFAKLDGLLHCAQKRKSFWLKIVPHWKISWWRPWWIQIRFLL